MAATDFVNYYKLLEIEQTANDDQIKKAISTQRRTWVKRQQAPNKDKQREAEDRVRQIDEAQKTLLTPERRKQYNQQLANYRPPTPQAGPSMDGSQDWLQRAKDFLAQGDSLSAAYAARQATEQHGGNHEAWAIRAHANAVTGHDDDAVFEFNEAIRIKPDEPEYHFDLGSFHESRSNWASALQSYQTASSLAPEVPMYRVAIASVYLNNDLASQALPIMEQIHQECPDVEDFTVYYAWALNDSCISSWTKLRDGSRIITKPEQIARAREVLNKANALKFNEPALRANINGNLKLCDDAEKTQFRLPGLSIVGQATDGGCGFTLFAFAVVIGFWLLPIFIIAASPPVGILMLLVWGFGFYKLGFQPAWKRADHDSKSLQVK